MIILVFLQNMYVNEPDRVQEILKQYPDRWNDLCERFLFESRTGKVIKTIFGDLAERFIYDETTKQIAGDSKTIFKADQEHIYTTLKRISPDIVISFGKIASQAVGIEIVKLDYEPIFIQAPHPAASFRNPTYLKELQAINLTLRKHIK